MNDLQVFNFEKREIRTIVENGDPWFVAKDVAAALSYPESTINNIVAAIRHVPEEWKGRYPIPTLGGIQEMLCLAEQGLYFYLGRSDKPAALPFQKLVAGTILPAIRKTGTYTVPGRVSPQPEPIAWCVYPFFNQSNAVELLGKLIESCDKGLSTREQFQRAVFAKPDTTPYKIPKEAPNAAYSKAVIFLRGDLRKTHPDITAFMETSFTITGSRTDFVLVREVYERYSAQKENPISRPMFSRHLRLMYPEIGHKQKKVKGVPELVFEGVKFREDE